MDPIAQIAEGHEPTWEGTFEHPRHGELTFRVSRKLTNTDWLRHSALRDKIIRDQGFLPDEMGANTAYFAGACAGIGSLMDAVKIGERHTTDEVPGHEKIEVVYYDPLDDDDMAFPIQVWDAFFSWRLELLNGVAELKKGSATTGGAVPAEPSLDPTGSLPMTDESRNGQMETSFESLPTGV